MTNFSYTMRMAKEEYPVTTGVRFLRENKIPFIPRLYAYEEKGGNKTLRRRTANGRTFHR